MEEKPTKDFSYEGKRLKCGRDVLGRGGFGIVYRGFWDDTQAAIKRIEISRVDMNKGKNIIVKYIRCFKLDPLLTNYSMISSTGKIVFGGKQAPQRTAAARQRFQRRLYVCSPQTCYRTTIELV